MSSQPMGKRHLEVEEEGTKHLSDTTSSSPDLFVTDDEEVESHATRPEERKARMDSAVTSARKRTSPCASPPARKAAKIIAQPRKPSRSERHFHTGRYVAYDATINNTGGYVPRFKEDQTVFDHYTLVMDPSVTSIQDLPTLGVRLDDRLVGLVLESCTIKERSRNWPADIDQHGMPRARRIPLGHASKSFRFAGEKDLNGKILTRSQEGWYYDWWRGLHCLMGKEGYDVDHYLVRPSFERFRCKGMGFFIEYKAMVQLPAGHPDDPTPGIPKSATMEDGSTTDSEMGGEDDEGETNSDSEEDSD